MRAFPLFAAIAAVVLGLICVAIGDAFGALMCGFVIGEIAGDM